MIRPHNITFVLPVLRKGKPLPVKKRIPVNNWVRKIVNIDLPYDVTIEETTKSIKVYIHELQLPRTYGGYLRVFEHLHQIVAAVHAAVMQYGWVLDVIKMRVVSQEIATTLPELQGVELAPTRVQLGREATSINGPTGKRAAAWIDTSKGVPEVESNDLAYEEQFIRMPLLVEDIAVNVQEFGKFARANEGLILSLNKLVQKLEERL